MILYKSTRGQDDKQYTFSEAILKGIAKDGGLLVPVMIPKLSKKQFTSIQNGTYQDTAMLVLQLFQTDIPEKTLEQIVHNAYADNFDAKTIAPVIPLKENQSLLNLWHGPTLAFKDMALQIMPLFFEEAVKQTNALRVKNKQKPLHYLILVATSGDTGKAALEGYKNRQHISIVVFYPDGRVSKLQELQMTTQEGKNVAIYAVKGDFDDAQRVVKEIFADQPFNQLLEKQYNTVLSSANSINWGRLLPQIVYYVNGYLDLVSAKVITLGQPIDVAVPTGNFGNILAAYYAKQMGLPIRKFICASNENNVLTEFLQTGVYDISKRELVQTPSPSMDILIASNIERLLYLLTDDEQKIAQWMKELKEKKKFAVDNKTKKILQDEFYADWVSNEESLQAIKHFFERYGDLLDPHTAVAQVVAQRYNKTQKKQIPLLICSTAHWAKFTKDVYAVLFPSSKQKDEFAMMEKINEDAYPKAPKTMLSLRKMHVLHSATCVPEKEIVEVLLKKFIETQI